jgi:hypothetical protein
MDAINNYPEGARATRWTCALEACASRVSLYSNSWSLPPPPLDWSRSGGVPRGRSLGDFHFGLSTCSIRSWWSMKSNPMRNILLRCVRSRVKGLTALGGPTVHCGRAAGRESTFLCFPKEALSPAVPLDRRGACRCSAYARNYIPEARSSNEFVNENRRTRPIRRLFLPFVTDLWCRALIETRERERETATGRGRGRGKVRTRATSRK